MNRLLRLASFQIREITDSLDRRQAARIEVKPKG
jgi:hypothetical protein